MFSCENQCTNLYSAIRCCKCCKTNAAELSKVKYACILVHYYAILNVVHVTCSASMTTLCMVNVFRM